MSSACYCADCTVCNVQWAVRVTVLYNVYCTMSSACYCLCYCTMCNVQWAVRVTVLTVQCVMYNEQCVLLCCCTMCHVQWAECVTVQPHRSPFLSFINSPPRVERYVYSKEVTHHASLSLPLSLSLLLTLGGLGFINSNTLLPSVKPDNLLHSLITEPSNETVVMWW